MNNIVGIAQVPFNDLLQLCWDDLNVLGVLNTHQGCALKFRAVARALLAVEGQGQLLDPEAQRRLKKFVVRRPGVPGRAAPPWRLAHARSPGAVWASVVSCWCHMFVCFGRGQVVVPSPPGCACGAGSSRALCRRCPRIS